MDFGNYCRCHPPTGTDYGSKDPLYSSPLVVTYGLGNLKRSEVEQKKDGILTDSLT